MASRGSDITPEVAALMVEHWWTTPTWQKLVDVHELNETLKTLAMSDLRRRHPADSDAQLRRRLAARWLSTEVADRVYGPIPEEADAAG